MSDRLRFTMGANAYAGSTVELDERDGTLKPAWNGEPPALKDPGPLTRWRAVLAPERFEVRRTMVRMAEDAERAAQVPMTRLSPQNRAAAEEGQRQMRLLAAAWRAAIALLDEGTTPGVESGQ